MKLSFMYNFMILQFKQNLIEFWNYLYGILIFGAIAFFVWWALEVAGKFKEDQREGKKAMQSYVIALVFAFGSIYFLKDVLNLFGIEFPEVD